MGTKFTILNLNETLIKEKIQEYLFLLKMCGYVINKKQVELLENKLKYLKIERIYNAPGDAVVTGNTLKICYENIEKGMKLKGNYYLDEVLFYEFTHVSNSLHESIYGKDNFIIRDYIQSKMYGFTNIELLE